jgi:hypothetical protein
MPFCIRQFYPFFTLFPRIGWALNKDKNTKMTKALQAIISGAQIYK